MKTEYENIKRIEAFIGGYFVTSYTFKIEFVRSEVIWEAVGDDFEPALMIQMDNESMNTFKEGISKCRILSWKNNYTDPHILDGTQWSLDIEFDDLRIEKSGSNAYPRE
ncbi:hypothetical protein [Paenibacillus agricola]|uniref:Uncharacterized protein n=1 Tax=Paenibacillus agricola TaxID=2716264 RepID=A0ABX0JIL1_9BACL|nr:hypothetical protein [Paenibacillus agricola]NHN34827.1 hypothetical protein [Paenibacillus agricola]